MTQRSARIVRIVRADASEPPPTPCPFCGRDTLPEDNRAMFDGSLSRCGCGAIGLGCIPADLDEAADQLLDVLGIEAASFAAPAMPIGRSGQISVQAYDANRLLPRLIAFFEGQGYQVRFQEAGLVVRFPDGSESPEITEWHFWIRPDPAAC